MGLFRKLLRVLAPIVRIFSATTPFGALLQASLTAVQMVAPKASPLVRIVLTLSSPETAVSKALNSVVTAASALDPKVRAALSVATGAGGWGDGPLEDEKAILEAVERVASNVTNVFILVNKNTAAQIAADISALSGATGSVFDIWSCTGGVEALSLGDLMGADAGTVPLRSASGSVGSGVPSTALGHFPMSPSGTPGGIGMVLSGWSSCNSAFSSDTETHQSLVKRGPIQSFYGANVIAGPNTFLFGGDDPSQSVLSSVQLPQGTEVPALKPWQFVVCNGGEKYQWGGYEGYEWGHPKWMDFTTNDAELWSLTVVGSKRTMETHYGSLSVACNELSFTLKPAGDSLSVQLEESVRNFVGGIKDGDYMDTVIAQTRTLSSTVGRGEALVVDFDKPANQAVSKETDEPGLHLPKPSACVGNVCARPDWSFNDRRMGIQVGGGQRWWGTGVMPEEGNAMYLSSVQIRPIVYDGTTIIIKGTIDHNPDFKIKVRVSFADNKLTVRLDLVAKTKQGNNAVSALVGGGVAIPLLIMFGGGVAGGVGAGVRVPAARGFVATPALRAMLANIRAYVGEVLLSLGLPGIGLAPGN
uniref:Uncharacterized protein n=1 Tax=Chromera velia CCMP2878 TaxID=1169474 RepID=A0A0G4EZK0_9ALVE|eukprot:Cvel_14228.t1-p1 / transcript=Cvel_14228.t1 / gene=Cvel_14228 / organism=Chromera_velia_CCMP2878 / gene_product=hypothetical protein / transcript_product=hypothetical protein / location=Cvel_scaffold1003:50933-52690(+) / protein_length=586 / sequence_SO=supercontig / SO=protein_coding / is_pseudo=false